MAYTCQELQASPVPCDEMACEDQCVDSCVQSQGYAGHVTELLLLLPLSLIHS